MGVNLSCPACKEPLATVKAVGAVTWRCGKCRGASIGIGLLKRLAPAGRVEAIWRTAWDPAAGGGTACPSCAKPMKPFTLEDGLAGGACRPCLVVWFEGDELRRFAPERQESSATPSTLRKTREQALAVAAAAGADVSDFRRRQDVVAAKARVDRKRRTSSFDALVAALVG
jgi:Zn-finger nucleic acid-binding protein